MNKYFLKYITRLFFLFQFNCIAFAQSESKAKQLVSSTKADTWVAKDGIGRELSIAKNSGEIRQDKYVGIFYMIWQGAHGYDTNHKNKDEGVQEKLSSDTLSPYDITKILKENPENPKYGPNHAFHFWGEPYFGYYLSDDEWVIRKHAQMLSDAGVDVLILDVTNAAIYLSQVTKIANIYKAMREEGISTPSFCFIVNSAPEKTVSRLYDSIYKKGLFKDLWFYWKGKPLLLTPPEGLTEETSDFFTVRQSWAWSKNQKWFGEGKDKWTWVDHTPQNYGWHESSEKPEQISVALAEHPMSNIGRSFHDGKQPEEKRSGEGLYFAEQWKRALEVDPEFVFVTGWNEWVAMRFIDGRSKNMIGKPIEKGETYFVDLYNAEYSRDAEPVKGDFNDNYYYQLVENIRKYKGARPIPTYNQTNNILINGKFKDWQKVSASFTDDKGDTFHRKHPGWGSIIEYVDTSGRNDIMESKVASDKDFVYFYVRTDKKLSVWNSENWMHLYIKVDSKSPAWEGFNFLINHQITTNKKTTIERFLKDGNWQNFGILSYETKDNELEIAVPKKMLGIEGKQFTIDFKWTDNIPVENNAMNWLDKGDTAPNARFKYRYIQE